MPVFSNINFGLDMCKKSHHIQSSVVSYYLEYREKVFIEGSECVHRP